MTDARPALFRTRTCALIEDGGRVLLVREKDDPFYTLPGGAVDEGEFSDAALRREIGEELGVEATVGRLRLVCENLFRWRGQRYQEIVLLFEARLAPGSVPQREGEFDAREPHLRLLWSERAALGSLDIRPAPVRSLLAGEGSGDAIAHHRLLDADF